MTPPRKGGLRVLRIEPDHLIEVLNSLFALIQYAVSLASLMAGLSHLRREFNGLVKNWR